MPKIKTRKDRGKDGKLKIYKLNDFELHQVRYILDSPTSFVFKNGDIKLVMLYNVSYWSDTDFRDDFLEGTLVRLCHPHLMEIIGDFLEAINDVIHQYEVINN